MTTPVPAPSAINAVLLADWLAVEGISAGPVRNLELLAGGTQNLMVRFDCGDRAFVLRRPPPDKPLSAATVQREATVLQALAGTAVPHPRYFGHSDDPAIAGGAFLVTAAVDGFNATVEMPGRAGSDPAFRRAMGLALVDGLAALAQVPLTRGALATLGKTEGFTTRQAARWARQLAGYAEMPGWQGPDALGPVAEIGAWLERHAPQATVPGLMHGDYHIANVLFDRATGDLAAILDWELTTLGDPRLDLARLVTSWPDRQGAGLLSRKVVPWDGFPDAEALVARYVEKTGRDVADWPWFKVLALYKYAVILEGSHARAQAGQADATTGARLHDSAVRMIRAAARLVEAA